MGPDEYTLILLPDGKHKEEMEGQRLMLTWESIVCYQLPGERYREDLWISDPEQAWPFWKSTDSAYLNTVQERSALLPEGAVH